MSHYPLKEIPLISQNLNMLTTDTLVIDVTLYGKGIGVGGAQIFV